MSGKWAFLYGITPFVHSSERSYNYIIGQCIPLYVRTFFFTWISLHFKWWPTTSGFLCRLLITWPRAAYTRWTHSGSGSDAETKVGRPRLSEPMRRSCVNINKELGCYIRKNLTNSVDISKAQLSGSVSWCSKCFFDFSQHLESLNSLGQRRRENHYHHHSLYRRSSTSFHGGFDEKWASPGWSSTFNPPRAI